MLSVLATYCYEDSGFLIIATDLAYVHVYDKAWVLLSEIVDIVIEFLLQALEGFQPYSNHRLAEQRAHMQFLASQYLFLSIEFRFQLAQKVVVECFYLGFHLDTETVLVLGNFFILFSLYSSSPYPNARLLPVSDFFQHDLYLFDPLIVF